MQDPDDNTFFDWAMVVVLFILLIMMLMCNTACTTTKTQYERVEVPTPYWSPPKKIKPVAERPELVAGDVAPEYAKEHPKEAFRLLGMDYAAVLAWAEQLYSDYLELVKLVETEPVRGDPAPPPE